MDEAVGQESEYEALIQEASTAYLSKHFTKALSKYNDALVLSKEVKASRMMITILKYMISLCLMESNKLEDTAEAIMILQTVEKSLKNRLPDIYCLLAKAHCKLYRFDQARTTINEADAIYNSNPLLETFYIPGTSKPVNQPEDKEIWLKIKEECETQHKPDAICSLSDCCNITPPYISANKNIFLNDPAFNGMVIVYCSNNKRPCSLKYHQSCWKFKKDQMYPYEKVLDKNILGNHCFTPNCLNDNIPCIISAIEVIGPNGEVKALVKESTSLPWPVHRNMPKGAIKKIKNISSQKQDDPFVTTKNPVTIRQDLFVNKPISRNSYEHDQILAVKDEFADVSFSNESPEIAGEKNFLFSLFHNYIQNNLVRVSDAYKKFSEINEDLRLKDLDIIQFLLETNKIEVLSNKPEQNYLSSSHKQEKYNTSVKIEKIDKVYLNKTIDIEEMYDELMNDDDYFEMTEFSAENQNDNVQSQQDAIAKDHNLQENYKLSSNACITNYDQAAGDTAQIPKHVTNNYTSYNFPDERQSHEFEKKTLENHKLREYIEKLESEMKELMDEITRMKKELKTKDMKIVTLMKEQEDYSEEVDKVYENMKNFQQRYEEIKEENLIVKKEMINLLRDKKVLEEKLSEMDNHDVKKQELLKMFKEEYQILEDHINSDWQEKMDKVTKSLEEQISIKKSLLNKCLHYRYASTSHFLRGHHDNCATALEIIDKINAWMESTLSIKKFLDNTEWLTRLKLLKNIQSKYQNEYTQSLEQLHSEGVEDIDEININLSPIPNPPVNLSELVQNALNAFYKSQCQVLQNSIKLKQQAMPYQAHSMPMIRPITGQPPLDVTQVNNGLYNHYSQQYSYHPGLPHHPPVMVNSFMPPPLLNFQMPRMSMPPPLVPQNYLQPLHHLPKVVEVTNGTNETSIDSTSKNFEPDSSTSENIDSKMEDLAISDTDTKEEVVQEKKKSLVEKEERMKETETIATKSEEKLKESSRISVRNEKMAQMKKACKAIALQIQQKTTSDGSDDEKVDKHLSNKHVVEEVSNIDNKKIVKTNSLELLCVNNVSNFAVNSSGENTTKQRKKIGIDDLIKVMKQKYPESLEIEVMEAISDIRRKHNNTLSRIPVNQILQESDEYMTQKHSLHTLRYNKNETTKTNQNETPKKKSTGSNQIEKKTVITPASSCNSLSKVEASPSQKKKTWNKITQDEFIWNSSGETECSICMNLVSKSNSYTLSCRHSFHKKCVKVWLKSDRSCPNCRIAVTEDDEFPPLPA